MWCKTALFTSCDDPDNHEWEYCDVGTTNCPVCTNPIETVYPENPELTYPCVAPQALESTGDRYTPRVVGGRNAIPHEFPFYVSIQVKNAEDKDVVYCTGSIVHKDWILTAQHCLYEIYDINSVEQARLYPLTKFTIYIGIHYSDDRSASSVCVEERTVTNIIKPTGYDPLLGGPFDIAFLKLNESTNYPPITLYHDGLTEEDLDGTGVIATAIGHGTLDYELAEASWILQKVVVPVYNQAWCKTFWTQLVSSELCAAYWAGSVDTCLGDSGGPLFVKRGTTFIQIGTVAYGNTCAGRVASDGAGVYMRLSSFHQWICDYSGLPASICSGTIAPTVGAPSRSPTGAPTTKLPTRAPTTVTPTRRPTRSPTSRPTKRPTNVPTTRPTRIPTFKPTSKPTKSPTTRSPTNIPTQRPTRIPSQAPTRRPTRSPTDRPTRKPTNEPTPKPSRLPTVAPTRRPTRSPTFKPTKRPTMNPTFRPTRVPSQTPTQRPSRSPTERPTRKPSLSPN